jgi:integrase
MVEKKQRLTARAVASQRKPGLYGDGSGLWLRVLPGGAKSWVFRFMLHSRARSMGLGPYPEIMLAEARLLALEARRSARQGVDPIEDRKRRRAAERAAVSGMSFAEAARRFIESHADGWRDPRAASTWTSSLERVAFPAFGEVDVREIKPEHVEQALRPIWTTRAETASRVRGRIEKVLDWAKTRGYRSGPNPAAWKANLDHLLPRLSKVRKATHHRALPWGELPAFLDRLRAVNGMGARALEFLILTAARSGEVRGATWDEIDLEAGVWTVPAERMKGGREHRVPLSADAVGLLRALPRMEGSPWVFFAARGGKLSDMTVSAVCRRMGVDAVPHGFRSSFRDWCAEATNYPREVAEQALAHVNADKVEAAYRRSDLFERRRELMKEWAAFCRDGR